MASSGIKVADEAVELFNNMKTKKHLQFAKFQIFNSTTIEVGKCEPEDNDETTCKKMAEKRWQRFVESLDEKECCYAVCDVLYFTKDDKEQKKLLFVNWAPEDAPVKSKMLNASSKDGFKKKLEGIAAEIQASDKGDLVFEDVVKTLEKYR